MTQPFGYFVHHQGHGHAERCAAIAHALPADRPLVLFCSRDGIFPPMPARVEIIVIPSLFEPRGDETTSMDHLPIPSTLHCAPLGWPSIRRAMAVIAGWFDVANLALMICDVSAEIAPELGGQIRYGGHVCAAVLASEMERVSVFLFTPC